MKRLALLLPIMLVLLTSGCTLPGGITIPGFGPQVVEYTNDIVIIKGLQAIPNTLTPGQTSRIVAYIQNLGETEITGATVKLYDYCAGMLRLDKTTCPEGSPTDGACTIKLLPKEIKEVDWEISPVQEIKLQSVCNLKIYVNYPYTKYEGLTTVHFIKPDEMKAQLERGEFREIKSYSAAGEGPVKAYLTVEDRQPIQAYEDAAANLALQIKNRGSGFLVGPEGRPAIPKEKIEIEPSEIKAKFDACLTGTELKLIQRESAKIPCKATLSDFGISPDDVKKELTKQLIVKIKEYRYEFRSQTKVTVNPKI